MERSTVAERILQWTVLATIFLAPFFFVPAAWITVSQSKAALLAVSVALVLAAGCIAAYSRGYVRVPRSPLLFALMLVPLAYAASAVFSGAGAHSFVGGNGEQDTVAIIALYVAFALGVVGVASRSAQRLEEVLAALVAGAGAMLVLGAAHLFFPALSFGGALSIPAATAAGSWQDTAILLGLFAYLSAALFASPRVRNPALRGVYAAIGLGSAFLLVVAQSQMAWMGLACVSAVHALYAWRSSSMAPAAGQWRAQAGVFVAVAILSAAFGIGGSYLYPHLPQALQVPHVDVRPSWEGTYEVGKSVFSEPKNIFFGSGPGTFPRAWGMYKSTSVNSTQFWDAEFYSGVGFVPTSIVTEGLLGLLSWAAVAASLLASAYSFLRVRMPASPLAMPGAAAVFGALYLAAFHVLYPPGITVSMIAFSLFAAVVASEWLRGGAHARFWHLSAATMRGKGVLLGAAAATCLILACVLATGRALVSDASVNRAIVAYSRGGDLASASRFVGFALAAAPENDRAHRAAVELGILQMAQVASAGTDNPAVAAQLRETLSKTINHGLAAIQADGSDYQNWLSLAELYGQLLGAGVEGAGERARAAFEEAQRRNPTNPVPLLGLARVELAEGNVSAARADLEQAIALKKDFAAAWFLLSQAEAQNGDMAKARSYAATAVQLVPEDPLGWYNLGAMLYADRAYEGAVPVLERAVALQNGYANALLLLGLSYYRVGRTGDALEKLREAQRLNPGDTALSEAIGAIANGKDPFAPGEGR